MEKSHLETKESLHGKMDKLRETIASKDQELS
jgi:hypothetical protein